MKIVLRVLDISSEHDLKGKSHDLDIESVKQSCGLCTPSHQEEHLGDV